MNMALEIMNETFSPRYQLVEQKLPVVLADSLKLAFGGQRILDDVSFEIPSRGAILLRGDNGSGKTTLLNVLSGFIKPESGSILLSLKENTLNVAHASPEQIARAGLGRLWQDIRLFPTMTVLDNVLAATTGMSGQNPFIALVAWPLVHRQEKRAKEQAMYNLEKVGMADRALSSGDMLSVGQMKRVAIARLLQAGTEIMLLDEPLAGMDKKAAESLISLLNDLNTQQGKTLLVVEHQHERMAPICSETWYLSNGQLNPQERLK